MAERRFSMISCESCGAETEKKSGLQRFCAPCGIQFRATYVKKFMHASWRDKAPLRAERPAPTIVCANCGLTVLRENNRQKYCSACKPEVRRLYGNAYCLRAYHEGRFKRKPPTFSCALCGWERRKTSSRKRFCETCFPTHRKARERGRRVTNPKHAMHSRMSGAVRGSMVSGKNGRSWEAIVGYSCSDLMRHLERQFTKHMSWGNMGSWHVDHVIPKSSFEFDSPDHPEFKACWALNNLRPMWAKENISKGAKRTLLL